MTTTKINIVRLAENRIDVQTMLQGCRCKIAPQPLCQYFKSAVCSLRFGPSSTPCHLFLEVSECLHMVIHATRLLFRSNTNFSWPLLIPVGQYYSSIQNCYYNLNFGDYVHRRTYVATVSTGLFPLYDKSKAPLFSFTNS
jgi:hypothetical protein